MDNIIINLLDIQREWDKDVRSEECRVIPNMQPHTREICSAYQAIRELEECKLSNN